MPESLFNKVADVRTAILFKKETLAKVFSCEFCEIAKKIFSTEQLRTTVSVCKLLGKIRSTEDFILKNSCKESSSCEYR